MFVLVFAFPFEFVFALCTSRAFAVLGQCSFSCLTPYPCLEVELIFNMRPQVTQMYTQHLVPAQHQHHNIYRVTVPPCLKYQDKKEFWANGVLFYIEDETVALVCCNLVFILVLKTEWRS